MYVSEFTRFLEDLKQTDPKIVEGQKQARAIWWDKKPQTAEETELGAQSKVRQNGYVYQTKV